MINYSFFFFVFLSWQANRQTRPNYGVSTVCACGRNYRDKCALCLVLSFHSPYPWYTLLNPSEFPPPLAVHRQKMVTSAEYQLLLRRKYSFRDWVLCDSIPIISDSYGVDVISADPGNPSYSHSIACLFITTQFTFANSHSFSLLLMMISVRALTRSIGNVAVWTDACMGANGTARQPARLPYYSCFSARSVDPDHHPHTLAYTS